MRRLRASERLYALEHPVIDGYRAASWEASFTPSLGDVYVVRRLLASKPTFSGCLLPNELVLAILDYARYHPINSSERKEDLRLTSANSTFCRNELYHISRPIPIPGDGKNLKVFDVRFTIQSRDQGWTTEQNRSKYFRAIFLL